MPKNCTSVRKWNNSLTSFNNLQAPATSWEVRGLSPSIFVVSFSFRSLICLCIVIFRLRWENCTSISFFGFKDLCQYLKLEMLKCTTLLQLFYVGLTHLHVPTGVGKTTPAVYTAWKMPWQLTLRVISLIKTGANLFDRSFLCTHKKLISTIFFRTSWTRMFAGTADINPTNLLDFVIRTPVCHSSK